MKTAEEENTPRAPRESRGLRSIPPPIAWVPFALLLIAVVGVQVFSGAYASDMADADEPAHFISGLLIRDYLLGGSGENPLAFAREYYAHYPKVAIGNWPPLFYVIEGLWMVALPARPASALVLFAFLAAALAWLVFRALHPVTGSRWAAFGAILVILLRPIPELSGMIMLEVPLALAAFLAVLCWSRFMDSPDRKGAALFAAAAFAAVLTKWNGLFLLLLPPLSVLIARRWSVVASRRVWLAGLAAITVLAPLLWLLSSDLRGGWQDAVPSVSFVASALEDYGEFLLRSAGTGGVLLLGVGLFGGLRRGAAGGSIWASAAALVLAVVVFHSLVPAGVAERYLVPALPGVALLIAGGGWGVARWLQGRGLSRGRAELVVVAAFTAVFAAEALRVPRKGVRGYSRAAETVGSRGLPTTSLVLSDAIGEGAYIAAAAVRDPRRPCHVAWRGTNLLALSTWAGRDYRLRAEDDAAVLALLDRAAIEYVVFDAGFGGFEHQAQMERVIRSHPARFEILTEIPAERRNRRPARGIAIYRYQGVPRNGATASIEQKPGYDGVGPVMPGSPGGSGCPA